MDMVTYWSSDKEWEPLPMDVLGVAKGIDHL
jgi:hypothetical protein